MPSTVKCNDKNPFVYTYCNVKGARRNWVQLETLFVLLQIYIYTHTHILDTVSNSSIVRKVRQRQPDRKRERLRGNCLYVVCFCTSHSSDLVHFSFLNYISFIKHSYFKSISYEKFNTICRIS